MNPAAGLRSQGGQNATDFNLKCPTPARRSHACLPIAWARVLETALIVTPQDLHGSETYWPFGNAISRAAVGRP